MNSSTLHSAKHSLWRNPFGIALVAYYLVMVVVGLLIPDDILEAHVWAQNFSAFMASIVPQIDRIAALNIEPGVNRFYFSTLWAASPLLSILMVGELIAGKRRGYSMWHSSPRIMLPTLGVVAFVVLWTSNLWWVDPNLRLSQMLFATSFGRSVIGSITFSHAPVASATAAGLWLLAWYTGHITDNLKEA